VHGATLLPSTTDAVISIEQVLGPPAITNVNGVGQRIPTAGATTTPCVASGSSWNCTSSQGRGLIDLGHPVAIGSSILAHGRWRLTVTGEGNHAGTTLMADRRDPMVAAAAIMVAARDSPGPSRRHARPSAGSSRSPAAPM
jgi:N-carbamoyl-L-amino-acid hydrolase